MITVEGVDPVLGQGHDLSAAALAVPSPSFAEGMLDYDLLNISSPVIGVGTLRQVHFLQARSSQISPDIAEATLIEVVACWGGIFWTSAPSFTMPVLRMFEYPIQIIRPPGFHPWWWRDTHEGIS